MKIYDLLAFVITLLAFVCYAQGAQPEGVAIQRVINNTRAELGQLAASESAREIADLMQTFDLQYQTWNQACGGGESFDPRHPGDACKTMADQMRETGIRLYIQLSEYLPGVASRYEQGARNAARILANVGDGDQSAADLYKSAMQGGNAGPPMGTLTAGDGDGPFQLAMDDYADPTDEMFAMLEKLVPDFGKEIPEAVRAGNTQVSMNAKAKRARHLAAQIEKARFVLESKREYGEIILNTTQAVGIMPQILGLQVTGTRLSAQPNQKVLDYYRKERPAASDQEGRPMGGGFAPRS